jgi:hypothetical protein
MSELAFHLRAARCVCVFAQRDDEKEKTYIGREKQGRSAIVYTQLLFNVIVYGKHLGSSATTESIATH